MFSVAMSHGQEKFSVKIKALEVGCYDYSKPKKRKFKVFYDKEAESKLIERFKRDKVLAEYLSGTLNEFDVIAYYPTENVALIECPVRSVGVFNLKKMTDGYGDPATYLYSPSGKYRFSSLNADGVFYFIEEKIDNEYLFLGQISDLSIYENRLSGFYWNDDNTLYYLKECAMDDGTAFWKGYSLMILE